MKKLIYLSILFVSVFSTNAQVPAIVWQKCYGGTNSENANCIEKTTDGGYIVAGYTNTSADGDVTNNRGGYDYWVLKLNAAGVIEWQKTYGGSFDDQANSIQQTSDGGYIVAGVSNSTNGDITNFRGDKDFWVLKLSSTGTIEWQKKYGGDDKETAYSIKQTSDGGYIVAGNSYSYDGVLMPVNGDVTNFHGFIDGWIVKLNSTGTIEWQKCLGGTQTENFFDIQQTTDGGYIATGDYGGYWLVKLNSNGNVEWQYSYYDTDTAFSVRQTFDGGYIMVGDVVSRIGNTTGHNFGVIKVDSFGIKEWEKSYGGDGFFDIAKDIEQTAEGGYVITGVTNSSYSGNVTGPNNGQQDIWAIKISSTGVLQWQRCFGGSSYDGANSICTTPDGGYILAGFAQSNNGNVSGNHGGTDMWILQLAPDSLGTSSEFKSNESFLFSPNPANDRIVFSQELSSVSVFDLSGRLILNSNCNIKEMDISKLKKGNYILKIQTSKGDYNTKLIKE